MQPSSPQCETMCHWKHTCLVHEETAGKVKTVSCSPNPLQPKLRIGKGGGFSENLLVPKKRCRVAVFCGWESPTLVILPAHCALAASMMGPAQSTRMVPGRGALLRGGVWAEVSFASGLEEERGLWCIQPIPQQNAVEQLMNNALSLGLCLEMDLSSKLS